MNFKDSLVNSGLMCIDQNDNTAIASLAAMMGTSFLEERWTQCLLGGIDNKARVSQDLMYGSMKSGSQESCIFALDNLKACAACYASWELTHTNISAIEGRGFDWACKHRLNLQESIILNAQYERMKHISNFTWQQSWLTQHQESLPQFNKDRYIHIYLLGVDTSARGTGAFRKLVTPILHYAQAHKIPCFLETYSPQLESLYEHFGFRTVTVYTHPQFAIIERGMVLLPEHSAHK